jgi:hypothetical protein
LAAFTLHITRLEHIYKPRFTRHAALLELDDDVISKLPTHCYTLTGALMDQMNLIFVGHEADIKRAFKSAGWHRANPASPVFLMYAFLTTIIRRPHHNGPFTPLFVNIGLQDYSFQKLTKKNSFSQRHHLRIWRTGIVMPDGKRVWMCAASYDTGMKIQLFFPFIHHNIDPNIDKERSYVARDLQNVGAIKLKTVRLTEPVDKRNKVRNAYHMSYYTDGKAEMVEI